MATKDIMKKISINAQTTITTTISPIKNGFQNIKDNGGLRKKKMKKILDKCLYEAEILLDRRSRA